MKIEEWRNTSDCCWKRFIQFLHSLKDFLIASSRVFKTENNIYIFILQLLNTKEGKFKRINAYHLQNNNYKHIFKWHKQSSIYPKHTVHPDISGMLNYQNHKRKVTYRLTMIAAGTVNVWDTACSCWFVSGVLSLWAFILYPLTVFVQTNFDPRHSQWQLFAKQQSHCTNILRCKLQKPFFK